MIVSSKTTDTLAGAALAALGVFIVSKAAQWDWMTTAGPGPGFFPMLYGSAMIGLSSVLMARAIWRHAAAEEDVWARAGRGFGMWLVFLVAIALLPFAGFSLALALLTLFVAMALYRRPLAISLLAAALVPAGFDLVFTYLLGVELPTGYLGF